jgi:hypothetical protein
MDAPSSAILKLFNALSILQVDVGHVDKNNASFRKYSAVGRNEVPAGSPDTKYIVKCP